MTAATPALRVAIVGAGPRGSFALERLTSHAARHGVALTVDVYDPAPTPGAGPVYDPRQPAYLRMNLAAEHVDAWWPDDGAVPAAMRRSLVAWLADVVPDVASCSSATATTDAGAPLGEAYVPRAVVGRYLRHAFGLVARFAPPGVRLRVHRHAVHSLVRDGDRWHVDADRRRTYDEVLVAGGHRDADGRSLASTWSHAASLVPAVFPVGRWLTVDRVPPGSVVALRGLALTAIDAILALTEGRGGRFVAAGEPSALRYVPGPIDPVAIHPYSRTGRPMRPKPDAAIFAPIAERLADVLTAATTRLPRDPDDVDAVRELVHVVASVAASVLDDVGAGADERATLARWTEALAAGRPTPADRTPREALEQGLATATGTVPLDAEAALGVAWRLVHPTVVDRFGGAPLGEDGWRAFRSVAAELERVGFGPSPENVAKLLALVDDGCVVLDHAVGGRLADRAGTTELRSGAGAVVVDHVIDAVLPGPGLDRAGSTLLDRMLDAGRVATASGQRGLRVDPLDATALDRDGERIAGLAAVGRSTEDATVGNDTLNRALHPQVDRWAERVVMRAALATRPSPGAGAPERPEPDDDPVRRPGGVVPTFQPTFHEDPAR